MVSEPFEFVSILVEDYSSKQRSLKVHKFVNDNPQLIVEYKGNIQAIDTVYDEATEVLHTFGVLDNGEIVEIKAHRDEAKYG